MVAMVVMAVQEELVELVVQAALVVLVETAVLVAVAVAAAVDLITTPTEKESLSIIIMEAAVVVEQELQ
jgi:hypothetical protein